MPGLLLKCIFGPGDAAAGQVRSQDPRRDSKTRRDMARRRIRQARLGSDSSKPTSSTKTASSVSTLSTMSTSSLRSQGNRRTTASSVVQSLGVKQRKKSALYLDSTLGRKSAQSAQAKFQGLLKSTEKQNVSKDELHGAFQAWGVNIQSELFEKIFRLFDSDNDGKVDVNDFVAAYCVLTCSESASDKIELAFELFDQDHDGKLSMPEFNEMIAAIVGNRVKNILLLDAVREEFRDFLKQEMCDELLAFLDEVGYIHPISNRARQSSLQEVQRIYREYIEENAPKQINVSFECREKVKTALSKHRRPKIPLSVFDLASKEAVRLLEEGPLPRYKQMLRSPESTSRLAVTVWDSLGIPHKKQMRVDDLRTWAATVPGLFSFFDELQEVLQLATIEWGCKGAPKVQAQKVV